MFASITEILRIKNKKKVNTLDMIIKFNTSLIIKALLCNRDLDR